MVRDLPISGPAKLIFMVLLIKSLPETADGRTEKIFTNGWAVKVEGGIQVAKKLAKDYGFEKVEPVRYTIFSLFCLSLENVNMGPCFFFQVV